MRGKAEKKIVTKNLVSPLTGENGGIIASEPEVRAMGFTPAMISVREKAEVEEGGGGEGGSGVGGDASRR